MLQVQNLSKRYGNRLVLREVSFDLKPGCSLGVRGANGAGKSTLLRILSGRMRPSKGAVVQDLGDRKAGQPGLSWVGHEPALYLDFSAQENLEFFQSIGGGEGNSLCSLSEALSRVGLDRAANKRVRAFSRGMKQRLALARLLVEGRPLWLMDEPSTGLDAESRQVLYEVIALHRERGGAVVLVSHHEEVLQEACNQVLCLVKGRLQDEGAL